MESVCGEISELRLHYGKWMERSEYIISVEMYMSSHWKVELINLTDESCNWVTMYLLSLALWWNGKCAYCTHHEY